MVLFFHLMRWKEEEEENDEEEEEDEENDDDDEEEEDMTPRRIRREGTIPYIRFLPGNTHLLCTASTKTSKTLSDGRTHHLPGGSGPLHLAMLYITPNSVRGTINTQGRGSPLPLSQ